MIVSVLEAPRRPLLRWHGGKWRLAQWIISVMPQHRIYVEPYGGAASVLLRKPRSYAEIYNDLDRDVVNLFKVLRSDKAKDLMNLLYLTPFARDEFKDSYENTDDPLQKAANLVVRSFMGFGSNAPHHATGFRSNSNRSGTTPAHDWANYPDALSNIIERLRHVVIENRPAIKVMQSHDCEDALHYIGPPYVFETRSDVKKGYKHEMTDQDHAYLLDFIKTLKGKVILSGYQTPLYLEKLKDWQCLTRKAFADGAKPRTEVLWLNFSSSDLFSNSEAKP